MNFPTIESPRLKLKKLTKSDAVMLYKVFSNVEAMRYWDSEPHINIDETIQAIDNMKNAWLQKQGLAWGLFLKNPQILIGECGIHSLDKKSHKAKIGYIIDPKYWRNGYASEALKELIRYAFEVMELKTIEAETDPDNISSSKILVKLGFVFVESIENHFMLNGVAHNTDVYTLTNESV